MRSRLIAVGLAVGCGCACVFLSSANVRASAAAFARTVSRWGESVRPGESRRGALARASEDSQIRAVLAAQVASWNRGDVDSFMTYYWRSEETLFVGANGVTRGWQAVLDRYHRAYPDRKAMGYLTFSDIEIQQDCTNAAIVIGEYHLEREKDNPSGVFTLNFRKFPQGWRIVVDHTTAFATTGVPRS
jgi:ketosteroid isomerase-like protein